MWIGINLNLRLTKNMFFYLLRWNTLSTAHSKYGIHFKTRIIRPYHDDVIIHHIMSRTLGDKCFLRQDMFTQWRPASFESLKSVMWVWDFF